MKQEPERGLPQECSGPIPRIRRWVFVCCCAPEVWCYCDRKRGRRGEGGRPPAGDVPVKSLCPCRALSCEFPQRGESCLCAAAGLPTCESPGPGGVSRGAGAGGVAGTLLATVPRVGTLAAMPCGSRAAEVSVGSGMQQDVAGRKAPALWPCRLGAVGGQSLCLEPSGLAALLRPSPPCKRQGKISPLLLPWCSIQPGQRVGSFPALLEGRSSWRAVSWLCLERSEWPPACLGEQLPCRRIAGIPAEQSQLSTADCALLRAQLPHSLPWWSGTGLVTSAQPGTDPFSRGLPVFHNRPLCPDPSRRPDQYLRSQPPALAEGATLQLPPASSPPAPPCPLSLPPHPAPWLPARCLIRCDLCRACISR